MTKQMNGLMILFHFTLKTHNMSKAIIIASNTIVTVIKVSKDLWQDKDTGIVYFFGELRFL